MTTRAGSPLAVAPGFARDVLGEVAATFGRRRTRLLGVIGNLVLALGYVGWSHWHPNRPEAFAAAHIGVAVVVWIMADVVNTNQLGADGEEVAELLSSGHGIARILATKNLALATVIVPLAVGVTLGAQLLARHAPDLGRASLADVGAVFCWLGVGSVLSVLLPYRPMPWRARLAARHTWLRWALCLGTPWVVVLGLEPALNAADRAVGSAGRAGALVVGVMCWAGGLALAARLARRRNLSLRQELRAYVDSV
ncbi:hypothetical protein LQ327_02215 [Actinomycetospora endophytica]|uniref:ABC-2 type transport system permease protein n=1 Tax=Actinomycetospora endophytica TaxID=2291215 RepID=A0ABS8P1V1_9PSEU|nr:hypothetical protein [Actinomycetospora endophytica]MCD2192209.1 hypothetical protein [Actinomycetospora endophytica]